MEGVNNLKKRLMEIRDNDWNIPEGVNKYQLALEAMDNIGSTDAELRDYLILPTVCKMIKRKTLSKDEIRKILEISLSDKHQFCGLGEEEDDSVFNRAFTILIVRWIIYYHNNYGEDLFSKSEIKEIFDSIIRYVILEKDTRGYVADKGWAHAIAHSADALATLSLCNYLKKNDLIKILEVVKEKASISYSIYTHQEHERLVSVITSVMKRNILSPEEIINWIKSFEDIEEPVDQPYRIYFRENIKNLLRSLYFRLKFKKSDNIYFDKIEQTLDNIDGIHNKVEGMNYY